MDLTAAWILLTTLSLTKKPIIYTDQPVQSVGANRHLPFAICWQQRKMVPHLWWCNFKLWRRAQLFNDGQLSSCRGQDCILPLLLPATPDIAWSCFPPLLPPWASPTTGLRSWHFPLCAKVSLHSRSCPSSSQYLSPISPHSSSSSVSKSYNHWPSLYSSRLFPPAAQAHTADLVSQMPRGTLQPALLFGDQAKKDFCGSELEHVWPRWDF